MPAGIGATDWHGLAENGILASTVGDAALGFSVIAGRTPDRLNEPGKLRLAVSARSPVAGVFPDAGARKGLGDAARLLIGLGHDAVHADPVYPAAIAPKVLATWFASVYLDAVDLDHDRLQPRTRRHALLGEQALRLAIAGHEPDHQAGEVGRGVAPVRARVVLGGTEAVAPVPRAQGRGGDAEAARSGRDAQRHARGGGVGGGHPHSVVGWS